MHAGHMDQLWVSNSCLHVGQTFSFARFAILVLLAFSICPFAKVLKSLEPGRCCGVGMRYATFWADFTLRELDMRFLLFLQEALGDVLGRRWARVFLALFLAVCSVSVAQEPSDPPLTGHTSLGGQLVPCRVEGGDTVACLWIPEVVIVRQRVFKRKRDYYAYQRLIRKIKKVYPYAVAARDTLRRMDSIYAQLDSRLARSRYVRVMNDKLREQFESQLRSLTYSEGRLLMKLIDRETGRSTYEIIKTYKGGLNAAFFQGVARMFGSNLKKRYDPRGKDAMLEELLILYEHGQL